MNFTRYLQLRNYRPRTIRALSRIVDEYENYRRRGQGPETYFAYLQKRPNKLWPHRGLSAATLNYHYYGLGLYRAYWEQTQGGEGLPPEAPFRLLSAPQISILGRAEVWALFEACQNRRDRALLACLYSLGLRASEVVGLNGGDFHWEGGWALIRQSKTGWQRQVPLSAMAKGYLEAYQAGRPADEGPFFAGKKGRLHVGSLGPILKKIAQRAGLSQRVYPHLLRHSLASHLHQAGMPLSELGRLLGHRHPGSTGRYLHLLHPKPPQR